MLSAELELALDSFIFIDDDSFECAQVMAVCPEVLTIQLPSDELAIKRVLRETWDLDPKTTPTLEDKTRTHYYQQNAERTKIRKSALSIEEFIASLELKVEIEQLLEADLARASQLTVRTNQFNINGIRRYETELQNYLKDQHRYCQVVKAGDRFGDYGTVGLMISRSHQEFLIVETLLLSCRALGKGIEHHMVMRLCEIAQICGASQIKFVYQPSERNMPLRLFLSDIGAQEIETHWIFNVKDKKEPGYDQKICRSR
jgi:FkbH-like protein